MDELCESDHFVNLTDQFESTFLSGLKTLFIPPVEVVERWCEKEPSHFKSAKEKADFLNWYTTRDDDEFEDDVDDVDDEEFDAFYDHWLTEYIKVLFMATCSLTLTLDGGLGLFQSAVETEDQMKARVYQTIHDVLSNFFLAFFTALDTDEHRQHVKEIMGGEVVSDQESIVLDMQYENEYPAYAVKFATDGVCKQLCDAILLVGQDIQAWTRAELLARFMNVV